jgi:hypothetical protein
MEKGTSMTDKEAMKLALFALDIVKIHYTQNRHINEAITALKERLADPMREVQRLGQEIEQEPVAVKRMKEWVEFLKRQSDNGQHMNIPSSFGAGTCWELAIELEQFINTQPSQRTEPPAWFPAVENILNEYGLQAIDFVADFKAAMKDAEQSQRTEPLIGCVNHDCAKCKERNT